MLEIYNEKVRDLLMKGVKKGQERPTLKIRKTPKGNEVQDLTWLDVNDLDAVQVSALPPRRPRSPP